MEINIMKKNSVWIYVVMSLLITSLIAAGCATQVAEPVSEESNEPLEQVTLTVSGSGGTTGILQAVESTFEADTPGYHLEILAGTGTGGGVEGVTEGILDVAAMARPPKDAELEAAPSLQYIEFGKSGQAIFVSSDIADMALTSEQANAVFFSEVANWSEVGGPDENIMLYVRDEGDSSTQALRESVFGEDPFPEIAQVMKSQGDMIAAVEGTPFAVGFGTWPAVLAAGSDLNPVNLDGMSPGDPSYPITGTLGIGFLEENQEAVQPLVDWLLSEAGQAALLELDVIVAH
jgi:phosphate transport system substrate-binding protein